jgi:hypothetical protein
MERKGMRAEFWWERQKERKKTNEDQDVCGWIILKWVLEI